MFFANSLYGFAIDLLRKTFSEFVTHIAGKKIQVWMEEMNFQLQMSSSARKRNKNLNLIWQRTSTRTKQVIGRRYMSFNFDAARDYIWSLIRETDYEHKQKEKAWIRLKISNKRNKTRTNCIQAKFSSSTEKYTQLRYFTMDFN